jgi:hypothetical protein
MLVVTDGSFAKVHILWLTRFPPKLFVSFNGLLESGVALFYAFISLSSPPTGSHILISDRRDSFLICCFCQILTPVMVLLINRSS